VTTLLRLSRWPGAGRPTRSQRRREAGASRPTRNCCRSWRRR